MSQEKSRPVPTNQGVGLWAESLTRGPIPPSAGLETFRIDSSKGIHKNPDKNFYSSAGPVKMFPKASKSGWVGQGECLLFLRKHSIGWGLDANYQNLCFRCVLLKSMDVGRSGKRHYT